MFDFPVELRSPADGLDHPENWRLVAGYDYEVSDLGRVRRRAGSYNCPHGRLVASRTINSGYVAVSLWKDNRQKRVLVHRLVVEAFIGPAPFEGAEVNHKDGCKLNNRLNNLEWMTRSANLEHAADLGLAFRGALNGAAKITEDVARAIKQDRVRLGHGYKRLARKHGVSVDIVRGIVTGKTWGHVHV